MTVMHLKGAKFSTPSSEMVETKAMGLGTMPLIMSVYSLLWYNVQAKLHRSHEIYMGALRTVVLCGVDDLPSLFFSFQPCTASRRTVDLLAIRPRRVRWFGELGLGTVVERWKRHLGSSTSFVTCLSAERLLTET